MFTPDVTQSLHTGPIRYFSPRFVDGVCVCMCVFYRHIAELIFYMEELRAHVRKYGPVMQRYYVQYLSGFDAVVLNELVQVSKLKTHTHIYFLCQTSKDVVSCASLRII